MKVLLPILKEISKGGVYWRRSFKLVEALLELLVPLIMASMIDRGIANGDRIYVLRQSGLLLVLGAAGLGFSIVAQLLCGQGLNAARRRVETQAL